MHLSDRIFSIMSLPLPDFHQISISKKSISNLENFKELIELYDIEILFDEPEYYILDGSYQNLRSFLKYWRDDV